METLLASGEEVLIFDFVPGWGINQDITHFKRGKVVSSEISEDVHYHGTCYNVINYVVLGEDGNEYFGNLDNRFFGDHFFMTIDGYVNCLRNIIRTNFDKASEIYKKNNELLALIELAESKREEPLTMKLNIGE